MPRDMALVNLMLETEDPAPRPTGGSISARAQKNAKNLPTDPKIRLRLNGVAPTDLDLAEFLAKLTGKPFFKQVDLIRAQDKLESGHVMREFEVSFVLDLNGMVAR